MGSVLIVLGLVIAAALVLSAVWPHLRGLVPTAVRTAGDRLETAVDKATASAALETLVLLFTERGDTPTVSTLGTLWVSIWAWQPPASSVTTPTPTVEQLAADVASLKAQAPGAKP